VLSDTGRRFSGGDQDIRKLPGRAGICVRRAGADIPKLEARCLGMFAGAKGYCGTETTGKLKVT